MNQTHFHRQDLLEAILMASEIGKTSVEEIRHSGVEDSVTEVTNEDIKRLMENGFISLDNREVILTEAGREIAEQTVRRHRLTEMLLFSLLGLDRELASEIGCKVEHGVRSEMVDGVCTLLGHPATCPHGRPIPPGPCCRAKRSTVERQVIPLTDLKPGERARIVYIKPRDHQRLHKLSALGLNPGIEVELHRRTPAFCLHFEGTDLALDKSVASDIQVSRLPK